MWNSLLINSTIESMSKAYSSNLTLDQWELLQPLIPVAKKGGRPREVEVWEVLNAIFYVLTLLMYLAKPTGRLPKLANGVYLHTLLDNILQHCYQFFNMCYLMSCHYRYSDSTCRHCWGANCWGKNASIS